MNTKIKSAFLGLAIFLSLFAFSGNALAVYAEPTNVDGGGQTASASQSTNYAVPTCNSATLNGTVIPNGSPTTVWFEWGDSPSLGRSTSQQVFSSNSTFSQVISGLNENSTYFYRAMASNPNGRSTGSTLSFQTATCATATAAQVDLNFYVHASCIAEAISGSVVSLANGMSATTNAGGNANFRVSANTNLGWNATGNSSGQYTPNSGTVYSGNGTTVDVTLQRQCGGGSTTTPAPAPTPTPGSCTESANVSVYGPSTLAPGQTGTFNVHVDNTGSSWWYHGSYFQLVQKSNLNINPTYGHYSPSMHTGDSRDFTFTLTAPSNPGTYTFSMQNVHHPGADYQLDNGTVCKGAPSYDTYFGNTGSATFTVTGSTITPPSIVPPTVALSANPTAVAYSGSSVLFWSSTNATSCTATNGTNGWAGTKSTFGNVSTGALTATTTFGITCTNSTGQQASDFATVTVGDQTTPPVVTASSPAPIYINTITNNPVITNTNTNTNNNGGTASQPTYYPPVQTCQDPNASNYGNYGTCSYNNYNNQTCQDPSALNYRGYLPCQYRQIINNQNNLPTVALTADQTNLSYNGATTLRWYTTNATSCFASGGSFGWAGQRSIGPGSFYTGSLIGNQAYLITCSNAFGQASDSVTVTVRGPVVATPTTPRPAISRVLITSSIDRNQPIVPTIDNTRPHPGDEINYTVSYQNIGTGSISRLTLRMDLPQEVDYMFSTPATPTIFGNTLIFNLGNLAANAQGTVTVRVKVRQDIAEGTNLNFPATLDYVDPSGNPQSVSANVTAQVFKADVNNTDNTVSLGANIFGTGFFPTNVLGWMILIILILLLLVLGRYVFGMNRERTVYINNPPTPPSH